MDSSSLVLAALLFIFTVRSENPATSEAKYKEQAEKGYELCPGMTKVVDMNMVGCFIQYLDLECACFVDAMRNLTGSNEMDDLKFAAWAMSETCNKNEKQTTVDYFIKILKAEFAICQITPEDKIKAAEGAVRHCTNKCPNKPKRDNSES